MSAIRDLIVDALRQADHVLLGLCLTANLYGLAMIYSATRWKAEYHSMPIKQAIAMCNHWGKRCQEIYEYVMGTLLTEPKSE